MSLRGAALGVAALAVAGAWALAFAALWHTNVPGDLHLPHLHAADLFSAGELRRARSFGRFAEWLGLAQQLVTLGVLGVFAVYGGRLMRESAAGPIGTGILLGMLGLAFVWLVGLPFRLGLFWWVKSHGILRTDWFSYVLGDYFQLGARFLATSLELAVVMGFARALRSWWPVAALPVLAAIQLGLVLLSPALLSGVTPLHDARLTAAARHLGRVEGVRAVRVDVARVRQDTSAPNAEAVGTGDGGRVVLWDTLFDNGFTHREITAVLGHEIGHLKHHDALRGWGVQSLLLVPAALLVAWATRRRGTMREPAAVPLALLVVALFAFVTLPLTTAYSRRLEAAADWTSLQSTRDPAAARGLFARFVPTALAEPTAPLWAHVLDDDHPTVLDRIAMADAWETRYGR